MVEVLSGHTNIYDALLRFPDDKYLNRSIKQCFYDTVSLRNICGRYRHLTSLDTIVWFTDLYLTLKKDIFGGNLKWIWKSRRYWKLWIVSVSQKQNFIGGGISELGWCSIVVKWWKWYKLLVPKRNRLTYIMNGKKEYCIFWRKKCT